MKILLHSLLLALSLCSASVMVAQLRLPAIISSGMVLQQQDSATLWGWAGPSEKVNIITSWNNQRYEVTTDRDAHWRGKVKTPAAGGPYTITIETRGMPIVLEDVLIGEVWVCSGQSNMEWSFYNGEKDTREELPTAANSQIRFFHIPKTTASFPQEDVKAQWRHCDSNSLKGFSAVGYFFGKKLNSTLQVPIGLINASWGGTPAEVWTPASSITSDEALTAAAAKQEPRPWWPYQPGYAYNAMLAPLTSFQIAGAIWYQGEGNTGTNDTYAKLLTAMIDGWRSAWNKPFPFYLVQIAPFKYGNYNVGALLQEAETKVATHPRTGMVVITDLVDSVTNIHPSHKREVGNRLANMALGENYGKTDIQYKSPSIASAEAVKGKLVLSFNDAPGRLMIRGKSATGFYIADDSGNFMPADAKLDKGKIILSNKAIKEPKYVRYSFSNTETGNVFSVNGLPLAPFRTDTLKVDESKLTD